ncbi:hypothetical protein HJ526_16590 [Donghicola sp. C2-DW-16]|uniref:Lipoprotein n=1 Tax=Donghicola mangrovi TaxID=2729614 RepID=A0ABX2PHY7_9RHOB|nr:hypothetical protein [Donghicola mangrovi]NVO29049.1 hypothetical protein [Donghicola mangrovi]
MVKNLVLVAALGLMGCAQTEKPEAAVPVDIMAVRASAAAKGASAIAWLNQRGKGVILQTASDDVRWNAFGTVAGSTLHENVQIKSYEDRKLCTTRANKWTGACFQVLPTGNESYPYKIVGEYGNGAKIREKVRFSTID